MNDMAENTQQSEPAVDVGSTRLVRRPWIITLSGCDDSTTFEMELTDDKASAFRKAAEMSKAASTYGCMPTMEITAPNSISSP
jgi:hypothetical protein